MDKTIESVGNIIPLSGISESERLELMQEVLNGKLDLTNPKLVEILKKYLSSSPVQQEKTNETLPGHNGEISCLCIFNGRLISGGADGSLKVWNMETMKPIWTFSSTASITALIVADNKLFVGTKGHVVIRNNDLSEFQTLPLIYNDISDVTCFLKTDDYIHTGCSSGIVYSIHLGASSKTYRIAGGIYKAHAPVRNLTQYQGEIYVCTETSIQKTNMIMSYNGSNFLDNREKKYEWTHIRIMENQLYAFDKHGDIYLVDHEKSTINKQCIPVSDDTAHCHLYVCEYFDSKLYIGTNRGNFWYINDPTSNNPSIGFHHNLCDHRLKSVTRFENTFYIGCTHGHIYYYKIGIPPY